MYYNIGYGYGSVRDTVDRSIFKYKYAYGLHDDIFYYEYDKEKGITYKTDNVYGVTHTYWHPAWFIAMWVAAVILMAVTIKVAMI